MATTQSKSFKGGAISAGTGLYGTVLPINTDENGNVTNNGNLLTVTGNNAWAEGERTEATAGRAHSEGYMTKASAADAHAEGSNTTASGDQSHAEGAGCTASGKASHAGGLSTRMSADGGTAIGKFNSDDTALFVVGDGTDNDNRSDAFKVDANGRTHIKNEAGNLVKVRGAGIATFTVTQTDVNTYVYPNESDVRTAISNYDDVILQLAPLGGGFINYVLDHQAVAVGVGTSYTWVREDGSRIIKLEGSGAPVVWTWTEKAAGTEVTEPSYFIKINNTLYPCTKIYCPDASSYGDYGWTSKWSLWMSENLRETLGTIGTNEWYVNNNQTLADSKKYGHLYTWDLAHQFEEDLQTMGLRAGADLRTGWHLPLTDEVNALRVADAQADSYFKAGIINATNSSGLTLDLTGRYNASQGIMQNWQAYGYWWCTQQSDASNAQGMYGVNYNSTSFNTTPFPKGNGNAIRLTLHLLDNGEIPEEFKDYVIVQYRKNLKEVKTVCGSTYGVTNDGNWTKEHGSSSPFEGIVNVDDFGAAGDGITDDTACFQMAMNYNLGVTGTRGKSYFVKNLQVGAGTRRTIIKNCTFVSPNNKTDDCLIVTAYSEIDGCTISNYSKAIKAVRSARAVINARIENCRISQCLNGIWMYTDSSWSSGNSVDVFDIVISKNYITEIGDQLGSLTWPTDDGTGRGIKAHGHMDGVKITENVIEYCWCGIEIGNDCSYFWAPGWSIFNNFFEGHSIAPIYISSFSYKAEWTYGNPDRRIQLYVSGNYLSDYNGGVKNPVYGSYDFWIEDWTPSIYPCYGNGKDVVGFLKSGNNVLNNGLYRNESYLYMCGPDISTSPDTQMKDTAITLWPGLKKYGGSLTIYKHHMKVTIDAVLSSPLVISNADNNVSVTNGLNEYDFVFSSALFTADRLLTGNEEVRILKIDVL